LATLEGDEALEATLRRLKAEVQTPREPVSGFSSAI
jgi:FXSXX-COOH protein